LTNDIDGLAALISACDAVVTVSNTTAHIAGALGKKTWVMPPYGYARIWYWVDHGGGNPWYPSASVRQQRPDRDWADLVSSIRDEVASFATAKADR
jgi:ADP-heptose:LPS heptosyltransferase